VLPWHRCQQLEVYASAIAKAGDVATQSTYNKEILHMSSNEEEK
jgi:hypothetical protein